MSLVKVFRWGGGFFSKNSTLLNSKFGNVRNRHSGLNVAPPEEKFPLGEKVVLYSAIVVGILAVPCWVSYNIPIYQGRQPGK